MKFLSLDSPRSLLLRCRISAEVSNKQGTSHHQHCNGLTQIWHLYNQASRQDTDPKESYICLPKHQPVYECIHVTIYAYLMHSHILTMCDRGLSAFPNTVAGCHCDVITVDTSHIAGEICSVADLSPGWAGDVIHAVIGSEHRRVPGDDGRHIWSRVCYSQGRAGSWETVHMCYTHTLAKPVHTAQHIKGRRLSWLWSTSGVRSGLNLLLNVKVTLYSRSTIAWMPDELSPPTKC